MIVGHLLAKSGPLGRPKKDPKTDRQHLVLKAANIFVHAVCPALNMVLVSLCASSRLSCFQRVAMSGALGWTELYELALLVLVLLVLVLVLVLALLLVLVLVRVLV